MKEMEKSSSEAVSTYSSRSIDALPDCPVKRSRIGDELQPTGACAGVNPYFLMERDVDAVQSHDQNDPEFKDADWWWNHERIGFLNGKVGFKILILVIPFAWVLILWLGGPGLMIWGIGEFDIIHRVPALLLTVSIVVLTFGWLGFAIWATPYTTNWLMSTGIGFFLRPFERSIKRKLDKTLEEGYSEFNRLDGQARFAIGSKRVFEAPFVEFDAYVERVIQHGGIFYRLMFVHRYTQKTFNQTWLSGIEASKNEVLALWDMLQRYMDVSEPLPDVPRLEPFRHLDPVTRQHDIETDRNPRYWRDLDLEAWKVGEGAEMLKRQNHYPWASRECKLTPQLGRVSMADYRERRPATAWPI